MQTAGPTPAMQKQNFSMKPRVSIFNKLPRYSERQLGLGSLPIYSPSGHFCPAWTPLRVALSCHVIITPFAYLPRALCLVAWATFPMSFRAATPLVRSTLAAPNHTPGGIHKEMVNNWHRSADRGPLLSSGASKQRPCE